MLAQEDGPYFIRIRTHTEILAMTEAASLAKSKQSKPPQAARTCPHPFRSLPIGAARSGAAASSGSVAAQPARREVVGTAGSGEAVLT
eukprot:3630207-Amphidinium_carterae.4